MDSAENRDMIAQLSATLDSAGIPLAIELRDATLYLSGMVDSEDNRQAALDVAGAVADQYGLRIDDSIEVEIDSPFEGYTRQTADEQSDFPIAIDTEQGIGMDDPTIDGGAPSMPSTIQGVGTIDPGEASDEAVPYFPPTDPVVRPSNDSEEIQIVGGFSSTSMEDVGVEYAGSSLIPAGNDDLADSVRRELLEDAMTTDLAIDVTAEMGVVTLRGLVPSLDDAEAAEEVAGRLPGVLEVREELTIAGLQTDASLGG